MAGVGKSELALQVAQASLDRFRGGIVRVDARLGFEGMATQVISFVRGAFPELLPEKAPPEELLALCWSQWPAGGTTPEPVLLVLDDLPSDSKGLESERRLCQGLPPRVHRLITRRELAPQGVATLNLKELRRPEALRLLSFQADGDGAEPGRVASQPEAAEALCQEVGDLPLALVLLGARLAGQPDLALAPLLDELTSKGAEAKALLQAHPELGAQQGVVESLLISWQPLSRAAKELAILLSVLAPALIPWELVEACRFDHQELLEGRAFGDGQADLLKAQLLRRVAAERYQVHPLVRLFLELQGRQSAWQSLRERWRRQLAMAVAAVCREKFAQVMPLSKQKEVAVYVPHVANIAERDVDVLRDDDLIAPYARLGRLLEDQAAFDEALGWYKRGLQLCEERLGSKHPDTATSLNNLAQLLQATNRLSEAEPLMRRALAIDEASYGPEHPNVARDLNNLALLLLATNRLSEAEPLMRRALAIAIACYGPDHRNVATSLNSLAGLLQATNRLTEAEPLMRRALAIDEVSHGPVHPKVAIRLNNLARLLQDTNRLAEAEPLMRRAVEIVEISYGTDHPNVATSLNNLARILKASNRLSEAESLCNRALLIFLAFSKQGFEHPNQQKTVQNFRELHQAMGLSEEAIQTKLNTLQQPT
jgi:tetratricopeptide (TPR) repeat protein